MAAHPQAVHPAHARSRVTVNRVGLWLFLLSESFLFTALLSSRYYLLRTHRPEEVNQPLGLAITVVLLLSSLTAYRAEACAIHRDLKGLLSNLTATIALGLLFLVGVALEWREAFHFFPPHTAYGTIFFTTTGIHAFHVLTGIIALAFVRFLAREGRFTQGNYWGVEGVVKYWHFVDVAWVFIYPTLYLVS
ncbi:Cytochrome c oxidase subunit 3 [bacterium HR23]|nr:Cytochrome c oxidase subunit 3 [bacterium HR23]